MITIVDYGMGNLRSVQKAFELFCPDVRISSSFKEVVSSDKIILPGVGAFKKAMDELEKRGLADAVKKVIEDGKPLLGICLGLQLLFSESEEGGSVNGLDVLKGLVRKFKNVEGLKIPHMGWNRITTSDPVPQGYGAGKQQGARILDGVPDKSYMYFVHSYYVEPEDRSIVLCETGYGDTFTSGVHKDNIYAFQFHPEKSQTQGLKIVKNFVDI